MQHLSIYASPNHVRAFAVAALVLSALSACAVPRNAGNEAPPQRNEPARNSGAASDHDMGGDHM